MPPAGEQSGDPGIPSWRQRFRLMALRVLSMLVAAGSLLFITRVVQQAPCWGLFLLAGLVSWPIWRYRTEYLLFRRRLVLSGVALPESRIRAFLWRGNLTKGIQVIISLVLAWFLLTLVFGLSTEHGYVLVADGMFLALIADPVSRQLTRDITSRHLGAVARRWPLFLINGIVLTGAIMSLDFSVVGAPDTRHLEWHQVAEQAFTRINDDAGCILWGLTAGAVAAVEALSWHLSVLVIPNLPDVSAKIIAWSFFLLRAATVAWLFTALLLGISVFLEKREAGREGRAAESTVSRAFFITIILLALPFFYAAIKLNAIDPAIFDQGAGDLAALINPCKQDTASRARLIAKLDRSVANERQQAVDAGDTRIDRGLDRLFADVEQGVDQYLDWYFTVLGEYQRLATVFAKESAAAMREQLEEHLFADSDFDAQLERLDHRVERLSVRRFANMAPQLEAELDNAPCDVGGVVLAPLMELDRDTLRASAAATSGVGAGIVTSKVLAKKTAAVIVGKVAAKKSFQTGAALTTKTLAKKGSSSVLSAGLGTLLCAPAGPMAIICGVTAGLATWLAVDKALVELDEALNREEMRADILKVLDEQKAVLGTQLKLKHYARVDHMAAQVNAAVQRTFVPYHDVMD
jgi:hypothetical protein